MSNYKDYYLIIFILLQTINKCFLSSNQLIAYEFYDQNGRKILNAADLQSYQDNSRQKRFYSNSPEFLYIDSVDSLVVGASLNIHQSSPKNPLQCGPIDTVHGIQQVEAFLWAYDMINAHPGILPGVELGAIILDTCSSHQKTARDVSNFFSNSLSGEEHPNLPAAEAVVGFLVDGDNSRIVDAVVDVTNPFEITTLASHSRDSKYNNRFEYPLLLRLSTPNDVYADAIISILVRFLWHYVSVIYESSQQMLDIYHELKIKSNFLGIEYALEEEMETNSIYGNNIISTLSRIKRNAKNGSKVVILLLSNEQIRRLFQENKNLPLEHRLNIGEIQWISIEGKEVFPDFTDQSLGVITVSPQTQVSTSFKTYFTALSLRNNTRNPWFHEYWEALFNCRGIECLNPSVSNHMPQDMAIDRDTTQTINALFALANAMELTRRTLCPKIESGLCPEFRRHPKLSKIVYELAKSSPFHAFDNRQMMFDPESGYAMSSILIYNLRIMSKDSLVWHNVGVFTAHDGLLINVTKARAYNQSGDEIPLSQVKSVCTESHCSQAIPESTAIQPSMAIAPNGGLTIGAIMPLHKSGTNDDMFNCGTIDEAMFENLLAFTYAIEMINKNHTFHSHIRLGAVVFDDCQQKEKAQERLMSFMSGSDSNKIPSKSLVSLITFSTNSGQELENILNENKIVHLSAPVVQSLVQPTAVSTVRSSVRKTEIQTILGLIVEHKWSLINLIYFDELMKNSFVIQSNKLKVCVDFMFALSEDMTGYEMRKLLNVISNKSESKVIVVLGNHKINSMILSAASEHLLKNFVWIGGQTWMDSLNKSMNSTKMPFNSLSLSIETYSDPNFVKFLSTLSLVDHNSIPVNWFHQYWQQRFGCHLPHSPVIDTRFDHICTGEERLQHMDVMQNENIDKTVNLVNGIWNGIKKFMNDKCKTESELQSIDKCPDHPRDDLKVYINQELKQQLYSNEISNNNKMIYSFNVWKRMSGRDERVVGIYNEKKLEFKTKSDDFSQIKAFCVKNCDKCENQFETSSRQLLLTDQKPAMTVRLRRTWSLLSSILSALGVISVLVCVIYFLLVFPIAVGTTVLGYQILFGLFLAFTTNFVFLIPVSTTVCALRRLGMSLSYTIIISGLLVKVLNTWRLMIIKNNSQPLRLSSPSALVLISGGLVLLQIMVTTIWLISYAPNPGLYDGLWKCSPNKSWVLFDSEIIVSLLYVIQLLLITIFFAGLTWKCYDQNREPRWIMVCAVCTAVIWLVWLIVESSSADTSLSIVCANLINASLVMCLLYIRKLYLFTRISRQLRKDRELKSRLQQQPFAGHQQLYGAVKSSSISGRLDCDIASNQLRGATRAPFERDYDDNISSCGSVKSSASAQVQCQDLYPMEVYDGGSQFAPLSSLFSQSNKSIYGIYEDNNTTSFK